MTIVTTATESKPLQDLLIFRMALHEAQRRSKRRNPPASYLVEVLDELGLKLVAA